MFGGIKEKMTKKVQCNKIQLLKICNSKFLGDKERNLSWRILKRKKIPQCLEKIPIIWMKAILI